MPMTMDFTPDILDLRLYAGDGGTFELNFVDPNGQALDVSGYLWKAQLRKSRSSNNYTNLVIDLTNAANGQLIVRIPKEVTTALVENLWDKTAQWDLQCTSVGSDPITILQGTVYCKQDVTR